MLAQYSHYFETVWIREICQYIQTIVTPNTDLGLCILVMAWVLKLCLSKHSTNFAHILCGHKCTRLI